MGLEQGEQGSVEALKLERQNGVSIVGIIVRAWFTTIIISSRSMPSLLGEAPVGERSRDGT